MSFHSVVIQKLLSTNAHIGRRVTAHHFKIFSEGTRNSVSIIDSDKTLICLRNACNFIGHLARNNARFLFVNTNSLFDEIITQMTQTVGIKNDTTAIQAPDCIVIFDTERKSSVIQEAYRLQIPVVGLVDSSMPWGTYKKITYPVPANDSVEFVYLFCNLITKTILKEQKEDIGEKDKKLITGLYFSAHVVFVCARGDVEQDIQTDTTSKKFVFPYESLQASPEDISETKQLLDKLVILKFNGSLGTKIGFNGPKCAIEIGGGLTCLDLIINQIEALNAKYGCNIPLLLVNAINAHEGVSKVTVPVYSDGAEFLLETNSCYAYDADNVLQSHHPLENDDNFDSPSAKGRENQDEMNSVNLAEVFHPLMNSGKLDILLSQVMPKSSELEESKLSPSKEDIPKYVSWNLEVGPGQNLRSLWMNINSIESLVERRAAKGHLTISELFDQYFALSVPKSRSVHIYRGLLTRNTARENPADPPIELGPVFENVNEFHRRFKSIPSVIGLDSLKVTGDVWFGTGVTLKGKVSIHARPGMKIVIPDGTVLENKIITSQVDLGGVSL
ncbi:hypothetical protein DH2020_002676 [Rehmannia glutinosa]|uniref:UTP--glucose-1-phosphate uridylyltransferase n=1 Tax=Rehmannia glutinosa TaxID=99300 RepID=A0ABR0XUF5_REHGL